MGLGLWSEAYIDANGAFWRFAIEISGYDGSISLSEF